MKINENFGHPQTRLPESKKLAGGLLQDCNEFILISVDKEQKWDLVAATDVNTDMASLADNLKDFFVHSYNAQKNKE